MTRCPHCAQRDQEALERSIARMKEEVATVAIQTDMTAYRLADDAIGLFLEYRDVHGYDEAVARLAAATECQQGVDAEIELRANGEIK